MNNYALSFQNIKVYFLLNERKILSVIMIKASEKHVKL